MKRYAIRLIDTGTRDYTEWYDVSLAKFYFDVCVPKLETGKYSVQITELGF